MMDKIKNRSNNITANARGVITPYPGSRACFSGPASSSGDNTVSADDAFFDDLYKKAEEADTLEEQQRWARESDFYVLKNHWVISSVTPQNAWM